MLSMVVMIMMSMVVTILMVRMMIIMMRTMKTTDGTATLPMTHACVKLLPPMPSRSVSSILVTTSPILPSHPALRISSTFTQEVGKYSGALVLKD